MKLPYFKCWLHGEGEQNTKNVLFLSLNFDTVLSDSTPENFCKHLTNSMKLNRILKYELV